MKRQTTVKGAFARLSEDQKPYVKQMVDEFIAYRDLIEFRIRDLQLQTARERRALSNRSFVHREIDHAK